ncbi:MAG TPA: serine hydrolase domain-containing protein [Gaiellaceae bacterium]|nr:serine hydrolase domain-containing protein [Gaiellaceae bacterium]
MSRFDTVRVALRESLERFGVPGAAIGIAFEGAEESAGFGVTSIEHPLEVDAGTLFQIGSITKTVTGTLAMRLVEQGELDLDVPVRRYIPDLQLADEDVAARVTMRHLLTHTGGWFGDYFADPSRGDDALERVLPELAELPQLAPLGEIWSYCNSGFYIAGRVLEILTGKPYESAAREFVLEPLGMTNSFFFPEDVISRRFAVGHRHEEEQTVVARPWALPRVASAAGGIVSNVHDLLRYARIHLGPETGPVSAESIARMREPVIETDEPDRTMALTWFMRELDGVRLAEHGGATNGQISLFSLVPEAGFALAILTNHSPAGEQLTLELSRLALRLYLGVEERDPEPIELAPDALAEYAGLYTNPFADADLRLEDGRLVEHAIYKAGFPTKDSPPLPPTPPAPLVFYDADRVFVPEGPFKGSRGDFIRDGEGRIAWYRSGGRLHAAPR